MTPTLNMQNTQNSFSLHFTSILKEMEPAFALSRSLQEMTQHNAKIIRALHAPCGSMLKKMGPTLALSRSLQEMTQSNAKIMRALHAPCGPMLKKMEHTLTLFRSFKALSYHTRLSAWSPLTLSGVTRATQKQQRPRPELDDYEESRREL